MSREYVQTVANILSQENGETYTFNGIKNGKYLHFIAPQNGLLLSKESADKLIQDNIDKEESK